MRDRAPAPLVACRRILATVGLAIALACGPAAAQTSVTLKPAEAAPPDIKPGLSSHYVYGDFRHVDAMPSVEEARRSGRPGKPILQINQRSNTGELYESGVTQLFGIVMSGYIKLDAAGQYAFAAKSNDGIRVHLGGQRILDDPDIHSDRFSMPALVQVPAPGWYPIAVQYFQRKYTAALELHWQPPGKNDMSLVPAEAFGHAASTATN
jgi:hypothetical protein